MRKKCALIVDDSKTAREVLAKRLSAYDIDIVKVDSAANAIDYLHAHTPDAVFMDYEMPGMDGFQALRVIKSNPNTATIPIMMYTSREGGLALSEARALGAIGVLPKQMEAKDLDAVMEQLHLLPGQESLVGNFHGQGESFQAGLDMQGGGTSSNVEYLGQGGMPAERVEVPNEVYDESLFVLKRQTRIFQKDLLASEQRLLDQVNKDFGKLREDFISAGLGNQDQDSSPKWRTRLLVTANLVTLFFMVLVVWHLLSDTTTPQLTQLGMGMKQELVDINRKLIALEDRLDMGGKVRSNQAFPSSDQSPANRKQAGIDLLSWAANRGTEFGYGENPYDDQRVVWLSELIKQLNHAGFQGVINLQAHFGDFCLSKNDTGALVLAKDQMPIGECIYSSKADTKGFAQTSYQTLAFANYINSLASSEGGDIEVFVDTDELADPITPYPDSFSLKTAGEWNKIAAQNQKIVVSLFPR